MNKAKAAEERKTAAGFYIHRKNAKALHFPVVKKLRIAATALFEDNIEAQRHIIIAFPRFSGMYSPATAAGSLVSLYDFKDCRIDENV